MAVKSKRLRFEILKRDGHRCRYCGATAYERRLHVDHVIPESKGGTDDPANLVTACSDCNGGKSDILLDETKLPAGETTEGMLEHAEQIREYLDAQREVSAARDEVREYLADVWRECFLSDPLKTWWAGLRAELTRHSIAQIEEAIEIASRKRLSNAVDQLKYYRGVLRKMRGGGDSPLVETLRSQVAELQAELESERGALACWINDARDLAQCVEWYEKRNKMTARALARGAQWGWSVDTLLRHAPGGELCECQGWQGGELLALFEDVEIELEYRCPLPVVQ